MRKHWNERPCPSREIPRETDSAASRDNGFRRAARSLFSGGRNQVPIGASTQAKFGTRCQGSRELRSIHRHPPAQARASRDFAAVCESATQARDQSRHHQPRLGSGSANIEPVGAVVARSIGSAVAKDRTAHSDISSLTSLSQMSTVCGLYNRRRHLRFTNVSTLFLGRNPSLNQMITPSQSQSQHLSMTKTQHLSFHGILAMRLHEKHCSGHLSLPISSKSSLSKTVRRLSGNVLKMNTAHLLTLNTSKSIQNSKPYAKTRRPP